MRILMVCLGNICRSSIAEGVLKYKVKKLGLNWIVDSAGTESYHIGQAPHRFSQKICLVHGIDISTQCARRFTPADLQQYDKIYAMAEDVYDEMKQIAGPGTDMSRIELFLNELHPGKNEDMPDPYYGGEAGFTVVYDMIDKTCDAIIEKYRDKV